MYDTNAPFHLPCTMQVIQNWEKSMHRATGSILDRMSQCFLEGGQYNVCRHFECGQEPGGELNMAGHVCFDVQLSLILGIMNSTDRREEKRNFLIQGRRFRRSFKNYCNYRYFMKLSRLLSIVKLGIDVLLSEHLQSRCIDSSMYRYTPSSYMCDMCPAILQGSMCRNDKCEWMINGLVTWIKCK